MGKHSKLNLRDTYSIAYSNDDAYTNKTFETATSIVASLMRFKASQKIVIQREEDRRLADRRTNNDRRSSDDTLIAQGRRSTDGGRGWLKTL